MKTNKTNINFLRILLLCSFLYSLFNLFLALLGPVRTDDIFWHVAVGREIIAEKSLPEEEMFLFTADKSVPPIYHEWLFQVITAYVVKLWGIQALKFIHIFLVLLILLAVLRFLRAKKLKTDCILFIMTMTIIFSFQRFIQLRPHLFSIMFFYYIMSNIHQPSGNDYKKIIIYYILPLILWINFHSITPIVFIFWGAIIVSQSPELKNDKRNYLKKIKIFLISVLSISLNHQFLSVYWFYLKGNSRNPYNNVIDEWGHFLPFKGADFLPLSSPVIIFFFLCIILINIFLLFNIKKGRYRTGDLLNSLIAIGIILYAVRFVWLIPLSLAFIGNSLKVTKKKALFSVFIVLFLVLFYWRSFAVGQYYFPRFSDKLKKEYFRKPVDDYKYYSYAYDYLEKNNHIQGNFFTPYFLGGYSEFRFGRRAKVFVDGRFEHYTQQVNKDYTNIRNAGIDLQLLIDLYKINKFILPKNREWTPLINKLHESGFNIIYNTAKIIIFAKSDK